MPTNTKLLKAKIVELGFTQEQIAEKIGISYQSLCNKINNKYDFKASEIQALCDLLSIKDKDKYFFCIKYSQNG